ncbi:hypothetical protein Tco_0605702 [Tanacetum coccineum]
MSDNYLERSTKDFEEAVLRDLSWLRLTRDEGLGDAGGDYGISVPRMGNLVLVKLQKLHERDFKRTAVFASHEDMQAVTLFNIHDACVLLLRLTTLKKLLATMNRRSYDEDVIR